MNKKITKKDNVIDFPNKLSSIEKEIEAIVFAAAEPLDIETIENKISKKTNVEKILLKLQNEYSNRGINLVCISKKWSFRTSPNLSEIMKQEKTVEKKLSRAAIETLAIIVYHQPVTRAEIEEIRGVAFGTNTLEILMELNWVKPGGTLIFDHGHGISTLYMHLKDIHVKKGQKIKQGEIIGTVGSTGRSTGPHLDVRLNWFGVRLDPATVLDLN